MERDFGQVSGWAVIRLQSAMRCSAQHYNTITAWSWLVWPQTNRYCCWNARCGSRGFTEQSGLQSGWTRLKTRRERRGLDWDDVRRPALALLIKRGYIWRKAAENDRKRCRNEREWWEAKWKRNVARRRETERLRLILNWAGEECETFLLFVTKYMVFMCNMKNKAK